MDEENISEGSVKAYSQGPKNIEELAKMPTLLIWTEGTTRNPFHHSGAKSQAKSLPFQHIFRHSLCSQKPHRDAGL